MHKFNRGFSLVEVMVGMVIGLIGVLVIYQVFAVFEAQKRTTTSGSDAQQNGMAALYTMEQDIRQAGYGINSDVLGCATNAWVNGVQTPFIMAPVSITSTANLPDSITIMYGNSAMSPVGAPIVQAMPNSAAVFKIDNPIAYSPGNFAVLYEPGLPCSVIQVSSITSATCSGNTCDLHHDPSAQYPYNPPGGSNIFPGSGYSTSAQIFNLGAMTSITYSVNTATNRLMQTDNLTGTASEIADNIVNLRVQYGYDSDNNGTVEEANYVYAVGFPNPATAAQWGRIMSIRIAVLARSSLRERPNPQTGACTTTTAAPGPAGVFTMRLDPDGTSWMCYRYKSYTTTIPLRNIIWQRAS